MDPIVSLMQDAAEGRALGLMLDYDGTLIPPAATLADAVPDAELLGLLARLAARPDTVVHIISGHRRDFFATYLQGVSVTIHAEFGRWLRSPDGVWELSGGEAGKGEVAAALLEADPARRWLAIGDGPPDEAMFEVVRPPHVSARVGSGATAAEARLEDVATVRGLLGALC